MIKRILPILALNFVNILGFSILIPILPSIVESYQGSEIMYGILISVYSMFQFFASPIMGKLSDVYGRRPVLILSQTGTLISWIIFGAAFFIPNIELKIASLPILIIIIARIFDGLTGGNTTVAHAYLADITKAKEKTKAFGLVGAAFGVGFLIGPVIGAWSYNTSLEYAGTAIAASIISLITLILLIFKLPESLAPEKRTKKFSFKIIEELNIIARTKKLKLTPKISHLFILQFIFAMSFGAYMGIIILYLTQHYQISEQNISLILIGFGIYAIINQIFITPRIAKKIGENKTYHLGYLTLAISLLLTSLELSFWTFVAVSYLTSLAVNACNPTFKAIISNYMPAHKQGEAQGIDEAFQSIGRATAPLIATSIYIVIKGYTFGVIGIVLLIPLTLFGLTRLRKPNTKQPQQS